MSDKKNNFSKLFDYFNGDDEDSEVEIMNYQDNYNKMIQTKNSVESLNNKNNENIIEEEDEKENPIISELYSNKEDEEDNDVFYYKEKNINKENENDFDNFKFTSFKPKITDSTNKNMESNNNNNESNDSDIQNNELNNKNQNEDNKDLKNEDIYQNLIAGQNSFGNINDTFNRSTSLQTEKLIDNSQIKNNKEKKSNEEYNPEYLINSKIFDELENKDNKNENKKRNKLEWKDKNVLIKRNIKQLKLYMKKNVKMKVNNNNNKKPIELILYDDAIKKRQKYETINRNTITENKLNSNRSKINKVSYQISMQKEDKKIESVIKKYSKNDELNIIDICLILQELKIFRNLLQNINVNKLANITDINEFKNRISIVIKDNEIRKKKELDFIEQIWNLLSIQKRKINNDIFEGFLKILFSSLGNINDTYNIIKQYLTVVYFGEQIQDNLDKRIKECIQNFFSLKQNIIAYKNINNHNDEKYKKIIKENEKNLTFCPNIKKDNDYNSNISHRKKNFNFNTLYDRFLKKEKDKQSNLNKLRKEKIREEMKEVKKKPKISRYIYDNNLYNEEIHEKLYNQGNYIRKKKQDRIEMKEKEEKEKLEKELKTYRLHFNSKRNRRRMAKSFDITSKPKGFDEYIIRNRKEILNKERLKEMKEKIPCGENYEKLKKRTITPFNITDMRRKKIKKEENNDFFTMKIKIPNGQMKNLKIDINSDPYKISNDFCKIYSIKDDAKQKLIKNIINCQNVFLKVKKGDVNFFDNYL